MTHTLILRTRPTTVEAKLVDEDNTEELARWVGGWTFGVRAIRWYDRDSGRVLEAWAGDYVVKTAFGHYKPVNEAVIFQDFDRVLPLVSE